jgi:phosphate transport system protein
VTGYDTELARLRALILEMGERAVDQLQTATNALLGEDLTPAYRVLDREPQIDFLALDADEEVFLLIARRQPAARDLRIVLALSRIAAEVERAADKAARVAHRTIALRELGLELPAPVRERLQALEQTVCCAFERSMEAVASFDTGTAVNIFESEEPIRQATQDLIASLSPLSGAVPDADTPASAIILRRLESLFAITHALNRIGNHAAAVAEQVIYVAEGQDVRFRNRALLIETLGHRTDNPPP